ncbi:MAG: hypothetical protein BAA01_13435 [Bacillus thermozeamaize]|uniref:Microcin J25-processing protein McjB C-terminal domain-containing protein n=1 Tax=Bacillus thermozeamaize TaxID=230954 RepID=A0A1Y3PNV7_9BACI|nr:MAG: hypothetical protein BAA01_13435 [Bacillus thermozeamaize]
MKIRNVLKFIYLYCQLALFDIFLNKKGFSYMFELYSRKYGKAGNRHLDESIIGNVMRDLHFLNVVCAWYLRKADCIHKTLLGYKLLSSRYRLALEMVVGIRKFPFSAHAWIRYEGKSLINEEDDKLYKIVLSSNQYKGERNEMVLDFRDG